jgi:predicted transcriptional regulator
MPKRSTGELERAVMDVLWDQGGWLTPGEVHQRLGDPVLAYTTVMTILVRLWRNGVAPISRRVGYLAPANEARLPADSR